MQMGCFDLVIMAAVWGFWWCTLWIFSFSSELSHARCTYASGGGAVSRGGPQEKQAQSAPPPPLHTVSGLQSTWTPAICSHINIHHPTRSKRHQHTLTSRIPEHISRRITEHARSISQPLRSLWYLKWSNINPSVTVIQRAELNKDFFFFCRPGKASSYFFVCPAIIFTWLQNVIV